jgi:hypothetical protein
MSSFLDFYVHETGVAFIMKHLNSVKMVFLLKHADDCAFELFEIVLNAHEEDAIIEVFLVNLFVDPCVFLDEFVSEFAFPLCLSPGISEFEKKVFFLCLRVDDLLRAED